MNHWLNLFTSFILTFPVVGHALAQFTYIETRPPFINMVLQNGTGATYNYKTPGGAIIQVRVVEPPIKSVDGHLSIKFEPAHNWKMVDATPDTVKVRPIPPNDQIPNGAKPSNPKAISDSSNPGDASVGLSSAALAGLSTGIIDASGLNDKINTLFAEIENIQAQINSDISKISEIKINLRNEAAMVMIGHGNSPPIKIGLSSDGAGSLKVRFKNAVAKDLAKAGKVNWISNDQEFLARAKQIEAGLNGANVQSGLSKTYQNIGHTALALGDQESATGDGELADDYLKVAEACLDVLVGLDPFTGLARDLYESITGRNLITGEELSTFDRLLAVANISSMGIGSAISRSVKIVSSISKKISPKLHKAIDGIKKLAVATENRNLVQDVLHLKNQKGLSDIAPGTRKQAEALGEVWVNGKSPKRFELEGGGYGITDGTRTFRFQFKPKSGSWKANFQENTVSGSGIVTEIKNVHMNITDM